MAITSSPGSDNTYATSDTITVSLTFSEAVTVDTTDGTPYVRLSIGGGAYSAFDPARAHGLSLYDALYLELAKRDGAELATLDGHLAGQPSLKECHYQLLSGMPSSGIEKMREASG